ncbi:MAG: acyl carrier protein [Thermodesulfobacteriota bacterium]
MSRAKLCEDIKNNIITTLKIPDVDPAQIDDDLVLFENDLLNLDSLDALELVMAIQQQFSVVISDQNHAFNILKSVNTIADFIEEQR